MRVYEVGTRVLETWFIQKCITNENEYSHFIIQAGHDETTTASLWVINFPATQDEFKVLCENGMQHEEAVAFFEQAAEDYIGSLMFSNDEKASDLLLTIDDYVIEKDEESKIITVFLRTKHVLPLTAFLEENPANTENTLKIAYKLCDAVEYIQKNDLPRRLLTIDNLFIDKNNNFLLGCFGSVNDNRFQSPEEHRGETALYNSDVNSIGVLLYTILNNGRIPLLPRNIENPTKEDIELAVQDRHAGMPFPPPSNANHVLASIILRACAFKPKARYSSVSELKDALISLTTVGDKTEQQPNETAKRKDLSKAKIKKFVYSVLTVIVVIVVSGLLIDLFSEDVPSELHDFPSTTESTTANRGINVIYHDTYPSQAMTASSAENTQSNQTVTDASDEKEYHYSFFEQIGIYHSGHYYLKGILEQDGESKDTELAITKDKTIYMVSDIDGDEVGMLRDADATVYLVNPDAKAYLELSPTLLKVLGMDTDELDKTVNVAVSSSGFTYPHSVEKSVYRDQEFVVATYIFDNGKIEKFFLDESGQIQYIESYSDVNTLSNVMIVEILTADVPPEYAGVADSYQVYSGLSGMLSFVSSLASE